MFDIHAAVEEFGKKGVEYRRYFHENPELSFHEEKTAAFIRQKLAEFKIPCKEGVRGNSTVGILDSGKPGPVIAFRADIDALPVQELVDLPYASKVPGVMHACGHDSHAGTLLAMAELFSKYRDSITGKVVFLFQQAEEFLPGGAKGLCEDGCLDGVDYVFGYHCAAQLPLGEVKISHGANSAAVGSYEVKITGKGGHGSSPHTAVNALVCAAACATALNQLVALKVDPTDVCTVSTAYISAGNLGTCNVIPETAILGGNIRSLKNEVQEEMYGIVESTIANTCAAYGCKYEIEIVKGYPATINNPKCADMIERAAAKLGLKNVFEKCGLGGEDFAYYLLEKPGCFVNVGFNSPDIEPYPHHNGHFCINDEKGIPLALELMLNVYAEAVEDLTR